VSEDHRAFPLFERFPTLVSLPRVGLGTFPSPVAHADTLAPGLWLKREDLDGEPLGGNKLRALEFLLGGVGPGDSVVTVGAAGSTHALATAVYAVALGARAYCYRWPQEMNDIALRVAERIEREATETRVYRSLFRAYARAIARRIAGSRWVPAGGSSPLGVLGQVNAGMEVAAQVRGGVLPRPDRIVVPLGTGGTVAGLALGLTIAEMPIQIVGARVVPRVVANGSRVRRLIRRTAALIEHLTSERVPRPNREQVLIVHDYFGGAYGRVSAAGVHSALQCETQTGIAIDPTYGAKALAAAVAIAQAEGGTTLFWLSFDGRWLGQHTAETHVVALG